MIHGCEQTKLSFVGRSIFKRYVFIAIVAITLSQTALSNAKRPKATPDERKRVATSFTSRSRRQTIELDTDLSPVDFLVEDDYEEYADLESSGLFCPQTCTCKLNKDVICSFSSLTALPSDLPPNVEKLNLAFNKLSILPQNLFAVNSTSLKTLLLQSNVISRIRDGAFDNLTDLEFLRLSWNRLLVIRKRTFANLKSLKRLYLDNNKIVFFHPQTLRGLHNLRLLTLDGNRLSQLHPDSFVTLQYDRFFRFSHIRYLYLSNNQFKTLPSSILLEMSQLQEVYLHGNPWECSCQLRWLHEWMRESAKYRCKKPILRRSDPPLCAQCAFPTHLKGQKVAEVSHDNITCSPPLIIGQETFSSTELFLDDPDLMEMQNDEMLLRYSAVRQPSFSMRFDGNSNPLVLLHCNASRKPRAAVNVDHDFYVGNFDLTMDCTVEYPNDQFRLETILEPYLNVALSFSTTNENSELREMGRISYDVQLRGQLRQPLLPRETGMRVEHADLLSDFSIFKVPQATVTLFEDHFYPGQKHLSLLFQTAEEYHLNEKDRSFDLPWVKTTSPSSMVMGTKLVLEGDTVVLRCKAMGYPKPYLSWILSDGTHLRPKNRIQRFRVNQAGRLVIQRAVRSDEGVYRCLSQSISTHGDSPEVAADIGAMRLHVVPSAILFPSLVRTVEAEEGSTWNHSCQSEGVPQASIAWITPNSQLLTHNNKETNKNIMIHHNGTIRIANISRNHKGIHRCVTANRIGASEVAINLKILETTARLEMPVVDEDSSAETSTKTVSEAISTAETTTTKPKITTTPAPTRTPKMKINTTTTAAETNTTTTATYAKRTKPATYSIASSKNTPKITAPTTTTVKAILITTTGAKETTSTTARDEGTTTATTPATTRKRATANTMTRTTTTTTDSSKTTTSIIAKAKTTTPKTTTVKTTTPTTARAKTTTPTTIRTEATTSTTTKAKTTTTTTRAKTSTPITTRTETTTSTTTKAKTTTTPTTTSPKTTTPTTTSARTTTQPKTSTKTTTVSRPLTRKTASGFSTSTMTSERIPNDSTFGKHEATTNNQYDKELFFQASASQINNLPATQANTNENHFNNQKGVSMNGNDVEFDIAMQNENNESALLLDEGDGGQLQSFNTEKRIRETSNAALISNGKRLEGSEVTSNPDDFVVEDGSSKKDSELTSTTPSMENSAANGKKKPSQSVNATTQVGTFPSFGRQQFIQVNYGDSFSVQCPSNEESGIVWEFYPYVTGSSGRSRSRFVGPFSVDDDIEFLTFNGTKDIFIERANTNFNGTFLCRDSVPSLFWTHVIVVATQPRFVQPGFSGITVDYGNSVSIPCSAEGFPEPEISWSWPSVMRNVMMTTPRRSKTRIITRVHTNPRNMLRIDDITHEYAVTYLCIARNSMGEVRHPVLVTVSSAAPTIDRTDLEKSVREGESIRLDCVANGLPVPTYEWILPGGATISHGNSSLDHANVLSNGSLVLSLVEQTDEGSYGCIATNPVGQTSIEIILTVLPGLNFNLRREVPLQVDKIEEENEIESSGEASKVTTTKSTPKPTPKSTASILSNTGDPEENEEEHDDYAHQYKTRQRVRHDQTAYLKCQTHFPREFDALFSRTRRRYPLQYRKSRVSAKWTTPSGGLAAFPFPIPSWRHRVYMNGTMRISRVRVKDAGTYFCVVEDRQGRKIRTTVELVVATTAPTMQQPLHQVIEVSKDRSAWATCMANGKPKPTITWKTPSGRTLTPGSYGSGLRVFSSGKLMVYGVNTKSAGTYTCTARNPGGSVTRVVVFKMRTFAPIIRGIRSTTQHVRVGRSAKLSCPAIGVPEPYLYWTLPGGRSMKRNQGVFVKGQSRSKVSMISSGSLIINRASPSDAGYYHCYATNRIGTTTKTVSLKVYY